MPKRVKRKTEGTADDSAKKIRVEKIDTKTDFDEIKGQNFAISINTLINGPEGQLQFGALFLVLIFYFVLVSRKKR